MVEGEEREGIPEVCETGYCGAGVDGERMEEEYVDFSAKEEAGDKD